MHIIVIEKNVAEKQKSKYFKSQIAEKSDSDNSLNNSTGKSARNTNLFILSANSKSIIPIFLKTYPSIISKNTGIVAFKQNINSFIFLLNFHTLHKILEFRLFHYLNPYLQKIHDLLILYSPADYELLSLIQDL